MTIQIFDFKEGVPQQCGGILDDGGLCGEPLGDDVDRCPVCGYLVAWKRSKVWTAKFGKWQPFVKRAISIPTDALGLRLLEVIGPNQKNGEPIGHFSTPYDLERWRKIIKEMSEDEIRVVFERGWRKKTESNGRLVELRGYGLLNYVLNGCEKYIRERPVEVERESVFEGLGDE